MPPIRNIVRWVDDKAFAAVRISGVSKANRPLTQRYSSPESIVIDANVGLTVLARLSRESDNIVVVAVVALIPTADIVIIPKMTPTARLDQEGDIMSRYCSIVGTYVKLNPEHGRRF